jgi:hypothetical protein
MLSEIIERFSKKAPLSVMARALMENALEHSRVDSLFEQTAESGYTRKLLFSHLVDLMAVVVCKLRPAINSAIRYVDLPASATAVYNKLQRVELGVLEALLRDIAARLALVIGQMKATLAGPIPGYESWVLDGNHLSSTQRRLKALWQSWAGPLPGTVLVFFNPQLKLMFDSILIEDGHAQERSRTEDIIARLKAGIVLIADRNFCTQALLMGVIRKGAFFVIRHHANMPVKLLGEPVLVGDTETGQVFEQAGELAFEGRVERVRRVTLELTKKTRDGDSKLHVLTNLPATVETQVVAEAYRSRWCIETAFQDLTVALEGEIETLGYPKAALFGFTMALIAYNVLSTMRAAIRVAWGEETERELSEYYIANDVHYASGGMNAITEEKEWEFARKASIAELAEMLVKWAKNINLKPLTKSKRGVKKPVPPRTEHKGEPHISTAKLLAKAHGKPC